MRALLGDERDELADLRVVDRVLDRVGDRCVGLADVEAQVEHQPLADLALGLADAVVGVKREARDLDRYRLGALLAVVVVELAGLVVELLPVVAARLPVHRGPKVAAATASASRTAATSCTRNTAAPRS